MKKATELYVPQGLRNELMRESKGRCFHCKKKAAKAIINKRGALQFFDERGKSFHLDHVVPKGVGGSSKKENLVVSCATCNLSSRTKKMERDPDVQKILHEINGRHTVEIS